LIQPDIYITEKTGDYQLVIPWLPDEIKFSANETRFASYDILDKGEVKIPTGTNIRRYSWESILPGAVMQWNPMQRGAWQAPKCIQGRWSSWRENGTLLHLLAIGTTFNHDVYLEDYEVTYSGSYGSFEYSISFIDARDVDPSASKSGSGAELLRPETQSSAETYTIAAGDTLWSIAQKFYGDGSRWNELYIQNQAILELTAKDKGLFSSGFGRHLFAGTTLTIKK